MSNDQFLSKSETLGNHIKLDTSSIHASNNRYYQSTSSDLYY